MVTHIKCNGKATTYTCVCVAYIVPNKRTRIERKKNIRKKKVDKKQGHIKCSTIIRQSQFSNL